MSRARPRRPLQLWNCADGLRQAGTSRARRPSQHPVALEREEARFSELLKRSDSPESKITEAIDTLEAARSEAGKIRTLMLYRMFTVLTPEQRAVMESDHQRTHTGSSARPEKDSGRPGSR